MALSANTVWEVRTDGADDNGGGFVTGASGVDRSQQDAAHATLTTAATVHTTTTQLNVPGGEHTVHADDIGNIFQLNSGTATAGFYQITAVDVPNNRWTVDRALGTAGQTAAGKMGGAWASPGKLGKVITDFGISGMLGWIKAGTYTLTTSTAGPAGPMALPNSIRCKIEGYQTTRGDLGTKPVIHAGSVTTVALVSTAQSTATTLQTFVNLEVNGNSGSGVNGFDIFDPENGGYLLTARNCDQASTNYGFSNGTLVGCYAIDCGVGFTAVQSGTRDCEAVSCTANGFDIAANINAQVSRCVARGNGGDGFAVANANSIAMVHCTSDGNSGDGFSILGNDNRLHKCLATNNGAYGFDVLVNITTLYQCASYNNTSGRTDASVIDLEPITLSGDPYVNQASGDLRPNSTTGAGALLRAGAQGPPGQTNNLDIGAVQHADPASGAMGVNQGLHGIEAGIQA
jgi:hypothetical protein